MGQYKLIIQSRHFIMKVRNGKIRCLFCDSLVKCQDEKLSRLTSHLENEHEVTLRLDLVVAVSFLNESEVKFMTNLIKPRMEYFQSNGEVMDDNQNIFISDDGCVDYENTDDGMGPDVHEEEIPPEITSIEPEIQ